MLSLARLRLPLRSAPLTTEQLTATFWSWRNCVVATLDSNPIAAETIMVDAQLSEWIDDCAVKDSPSVRHIYVDLT
jgi:hypothetical protein